MVNIHGRGGGGGWWRERGFFLKLPVITAPETLTVEISLPFPSWENFNISKKINWLSLCFFLEPVWKGPRKLDNEGLRVHSDGFHSVSFIVTYCGKKPSLTTILYFTSSCEERDRRLKIDLTNNLNRISSIIRVFSQWICKEGVSFQCSSVKQYLRIYERWKVAQSAHHGKKQRPGWFSEG